MENKKTSSDWKNIARVTLKKHSSVVVLLAIVILASCISDVFLTTNNILNGLGIKPKKLEELQKHLKDSNGKIPEQDNKAHIGLFNVNERIQLSYGSEYGLSIESMEGIGTSVEIVLPKQLI